VALSLPDAKDRISTILSAYKAVSGTSRDLLTSTMTSGKVYEAWVLTHVLEMLRTQEGYDVTLVGGDKVRLKSSPGPINRSYAHFRLRRDNSPGLEVWTDVEFMTLSSSLRSGAVPGPGDYHEIDILVVAEGATSRPGHDQVLLGVECKNTGFEKDMMRAALGVRRELSFLTEPAPTIFHSWPRSTVPAYPSSVYAVYSNDPGVAKYDEAGKVFGVDFIYETM